MIDAPETHESLAKRLDAGGAGTGSVSMAVGPTLTQANASSYGQVGSDLATNASTTGKLKLNLTGYVRPDIEDYQFDWKIQYSTNGGSSWTDVSGMPVVSGLTTTNLSGNIVGGLTLTAGPYTVTGLGSSTPCLVRALLQKHSGAATGTSPLSTNLTLTAEQVA